MRSDLVDSEAGTKGATEADVARAIASVSQANAQVFCVALHHNVIAYRARLSGRNILLHRAGAIPIIFQVVVKLINDREIVEYGCCTILARAVWLKT